MTAGGPLFGPQAGYNWQRDSLVLGLESDISSGFANTMNATLPLSTATTAAGVSWFGTVRGRIGWSQGPFLVYGTGGLAYGGLQIDSGMSGNGVTFQSQTSPVRAGWVAGAGLDYMVHPNLILDFGYRYVDLGSASLSTSGTVGGTTLSQSVTSRAQFHVFTFGLSWLFSPKSPNGAWEGFYAGGHLGGAVGDTTNGTYTETLAASDVRLKRDVVLIGRLDDGLGLYRFRYIWSDEVMVGVMAQEVALRHPEAVVRDAADDFLRVDYGRLGLKPMTWSEWQAVSRGEKL
jgi:outer membrane immunogenic protein